jgi:ATP-dependent helicase/nuclease subunit A
VLRPPRAVRSAASDDAQPALWRDTLTVPRHEPEEVLREQEAAQVAQAIAALVVEDGVAPGDIFVLSRKRQSLRFVAQALRARRVPYAAVEETALMDAPEARDLVALLDALASPRHRLSLAPALRSPLFGAGDDDLIALARRALADHHGDWWQALEAGDGAWAPALQRAGQLLPRWRAAALALPPHDLLDRIVHEGELRERVAATVPPVQRAAALDAIDAVLAQALTLDGARYATPYNFVRALRRRAIKAASPSHADAVQLLTVHGAKGLEAQVVFVMDADPEPKNPETATLLIDWPVEAEAPRRCAFVYAESACPPSLAGVLDAEVQARQREELNGLYVAMSRARQRLVFSATEPSRRLPAASWWNRIEPVAVAAPATPVSVAIDDATVPPATLLTLAFAPRPAPERRPPREPDTDATRLGKAVHRTLEWAAAGADMADETAWADLAQGAALEFDAPVGAVAALARTILRSPEAARFFGGPRLGWAGNEVPVGAAGEALRIDRLVRLDEADGPVWWVLDYKLAHAPDQLDAYRAQLLRYRDAVRTAQPGATVRCAFITGSGAVRELD